MRAMLLTAVFLAGAGCGDEDSPTECSVYDIDGAYLVKYEEQNGGTCGAMQDEIEIYDSGGYDASQSGMSVNPCRQISVDISEDECHRTIETECRLTEVGARFRTISAIEQMTGNGSEMEGYLTVRVFSLYTDALLCSSTYEVTATRQ
jgi:hypothetical protein